jgi:hypothetical protein
MTLPQRASDIDLAERLSYIGASEISSLFNIDYGCCRRMWLEKRGAELDGAPVFNPHMERGKALEGIVVERIAADHPDYAIRFDGQLFRHPEYSFIAAHPDRFVAIPEREDEGILEIKAPAERTFDSLAVDGAPFGWILQAQTQMLVTGKRWGFLAPFGTREWAVNLIPVEYDPEIAAKIVEAATAFWALVQDKSDMLGPARLERSDDFRCKKCAYSLKCRGAEIMAVVTGGADVAMTNTEYDAIVSAFDDKRIETGKTEKIVDESYAADIFAHQRHKAAVEVATKALDDFRETVKVRLGDCEGVETSMGSISYRATKAKGSKAPTRQLRFNPK